MQDNTSTRNYIKRLLCFFALLFVSASSYASHIVAADLYYTWQSGYTYKITVVLYGDCGPASSSAFGMLPTSTPQVCVYNGNTLATTLSLAIQPPSAGVEVTPVCPDSIGHTQCSSPSSTTPGIKKFVYSGNYTLAGPSHNWRFIFDGNLGSGGTAGRAAAITNITGTSTMQLIDTLDNTYHANNSSPILTTVPTPFYCLDHAACYSPSAVDADADSVRFALTAAVNGTTVCGAVGSAVSYATAFPAWPGQPIGPATPLQVATGTFSLDGTTGSLCFNPNQLQRSAVVYNIREYRNDTFIGSCQRELTILVQNCIVPNPSGVYNSATAGVIDDSTHFTVCSNTGPFSIFMNPTEIGTSYNITVTPSGLPPGLTFTTVGNGTHTPSCTISWNTTSVAPGTYPFYVNFADNACPLAGSLTRAFYITIVPGPDPGTIGGPTSVCTGSSISLTETVTGGVWSTTSSNITLSSSGVVTGVSAGTAVVSYTITSVSCGSLSATYIVTVTPSPAPITGILSLCAGGTTILSDATPGGSWASSNPSVATFTGTGPIVVSGVSPGSSVIAYTLSSGCFVTKTVTVYATPTPITGPLSFCTGTTSTLASTPAGGTWTSDNLPVASFIGSSSVISGNTPGTSVITYALSTGCFATAIVTVLPLPSPGAISGPSSVCVGSTISLTDPVTGGTWSSSNSHASISSTGMVTGVSGGTSTISYTVTNTCGTAAATKTVTVDIPPVAGTITGPSTVCVGSTIALTDAAPGGVWSTTTPNASITSAGLLTGVSAGTTIVSYTVTNSCGTAAATKSVTVQVLPVVSPITGLNVVCVAASITLSDVTPGGTWSSTSANVTVASGGLVTGVNAGTATISYTVTNSCGPVSAVYIITVNPLPNPGTITGPTSVCAGTSIILTDAAPGGTWSSTSANATITSGGVVSGITPGTATISYTVTNSCGTAAATTIITVDPAPNAGAISGPAVVCVASSILLSDAAPGGVWSSTTTNASVSATGLVTGVSAGTTVISYTVTNSCGTAAVAYPVTVNPLPNAGTITGPSSVCVGSSITLTDVAPGGVWSSTTANATITSGGIVAGVSAGTTIISYTVTNSCGTIAATKLILINPLPDAGTISGPAVVCEGAAIILSDAGAAGTWSSSNGNASAGLGGVITGVTAGTVTISYTVTNVCGTAVATYPITVNPLPVPGTITGPGVVCVAATISLSDAATGGVWSSTANASISSTGIVTGITPGTATIKYTVTNSCGTLAAGSVITVNPLPNAGAISGPAVVCEAATISLTETVSGGVWSSGSSNASVSATGVVSGVTAGTATISYSVTNSCGTAVTTKIVSVNPLPVITSIIAPSFVCVGVTATLSATPATGTWSSTSAIISITAAGAVTGINPGTATVKYSYTNSCGTKDTLLSMTVNPQPVAGTITGPAILCAGSNVILSDAAPGGIWSSTPNVSVSSSGLVTGLSSGTATVSYSVTNMCGTAVATYVVSINPVPNPITGSSSVCAGLTTTLTTTTAGGTWSSSDIAIAPVGSASGIVTGAAPGTAVILYTLPTGCQSIIAFTVNPLPNAGTITGPPAVCAAASIVLTDAAPGGTWSSSNANVIVLPGGTIIGTAAGTSIISYTVTNVCGTAIATKTVTIDPAPNAGTISGTATVCVLAATTLTDPAPGGTWSTGSTHATVSAAGVVTGVSAGTATISYSATNSCGTDVATYIITVNPLPVAGTITGPFAFCLGSSITLSDAAPGGSWSSSSGIAIVSSGGNVTGTAGGNAIISYSVTNTCGTAVATHPVTVDIFPVAGTISGPSSVCLLANITLTESVPGGTWSSSTGASVSAAGVVTGLITGTATITYTITNTCGTASTTKTITVDPLPDPGTITGPSSLCQGTTITLTDPMPGGTWSSADPTASVTSSGVVTGLSGGTATISYTVIGVYCPAAATHTITVNPLPDAGIILGLPTVCVGNTLILTDASPGGVWSSPNPDVVVSTTGGVYGITAGTAIISYTVVNPCGTAVATRTITINPLPVPGTLSGPSIICQDSALLFTSSVPGGIWTTSTPTVATVTSWGLVFAVGGGTATISYTVALAGCTNFVNKVITVNPLPNAGMLNHPAPVCLGTPIVMVASLPGGVWSAGDPSVSITSTGVVTGLAAGSYYVSYTVTNSCGSATALQLLTFYPLPDPGTITGPSFICMGSNATYVETALIGTWSASGMATVSPTGIVTGTAPGTATISFTATNGVCTSLNTRVISINPTPAVGPIGGPTGACLGNTLTLTNITPGGIWSSSGAAVSVSPAGVVTGLAAGTGVISYELTNACGTARATQTVEIFVAPPAGTITGPANMCLGQSQTLTNTAGGGIWSSSNGSIATVGSSTGEVLGIAAGTAMITYTVSAGPGCTNYATYPVTVSPVPNAGTISAPSSFCKGAVFNVTATMPGGTWTTSDGTIVSIGSNGSATAAAPGTAIITYSIGANSCAAQATVAITILSAPAFTLGSSITNPACFDAANGVIATTIAGANGPVTYNWSNGSTDASLSNIAAGTYTVQVTETNTFCKMVDVLTVTAPDAIAITPVITNDDCNKSAGKISVTVTGGMPPYTYQWSNNSTSAEASNLAAGTYSLSVTDINTCRKDASLIVADDSCLEIVIHDAITPNGDGVNDKWIIEGLDRYPNNLIQVFDKWGDLIFEERNYNNTWVARGKDGTVVPDGTYFYLLKLYADSLPGGQRVVTGSILIKR